MSTKYASGNSLSSAGSYRSKSGKSFKASPSVKENVSGNTSGSMSKKELMALKKQESARLVREERQRLKEEKERKQKEFLEKTANRREEQELNLEIQRMTAKHNYILAATQKEIEAADLQWKLEQERLHRKDLEDARKQERLRESALKEKARNERADTIRRMKEEAEKAENESRQLDTAAYNDVQEYLKNEKDARRRSLQRKHEEESSFKKQESYKAQQRELEEIRNRELEIAAYNDMKRYLASEKAKRRQSLADFLVQESQYRAKLQADKEEQDMKDSASRQLDELARKDAINAVNREKSARRESLAFRLYQSSQHDCQALINDMEDHEDQILMKRMESELRDDEERERLEEEECQRMIETRDKLNQLRAIERQEHVQNAHLEKIQKAREATMDIEDDAMTLEEELTDQEEFHEGSDIENSEVVEEEPFPDIIEELPDMIPEEEEHEIEEAEVKVEEVVAEPASEPIPPPATEPPQMSNPKRPTSKDCCVIC